jgi:dephospho-CoA kinase
MFSIGITGGIGSGKTFIADILKANFDIKIFDSDNSAKEIIQNNKLVKKSIILNFGKKSYIGDEINNKIISKIIFNNHDKLVKLNSIVHPLVFKDFEDFKLKYSDKIIIVESALLFESGMYLSNDINILVTSPLEIKLQRLILRDKRNKEDVLKIIKSQWHDSKKTELADFVIENINKLETEKKIKKLMIDIISKYEEN